MKRRYPPEVDATTFKTNIETATGGRVQVDVENQASSERAARSQIMTATPC